MTETGQACSTNAVGSARAAVGEADAARQGLRGEIEFALAPDGPWIGCQEPGEGHARQGAEGRDAAFPRRRRRRGRGGSRRWSTLVERRFDEESSRMNASPLQGRAAAPGLALGPIRRAGASRTPSVSRERRPGRRGRALRRHATSACRGTRAVDGRARTGEARRHARLSGRDARGRSARRAALRCDRRGRSGGPRPGAALDQRDRRLRDGRRTSISAPAPATSRDIRDRVLAH